MEYVTKMLIYRKSNQWTVWHFNSIIRCAFHSLAVPPLELWHEPQCKRVRIFCVAVVFLRIEIFFLDYAWQQNIKKRKISREETKRRKKNNGDHRKLYAYFLWNVKWHSFVSDNRQISCVLLCVRGSIDADHDQRHLNIFLTIGLRGTHTGFAPKCASAIVAKLKRNAVQIKSTKTQMGKKNTIYTKESESNTTE